MSRTAYFWPPASLYHDTGRHLESVARAECLQPEKMESRLSGLGVRPIVAHNSADWVLKVHEPNYHAFVEDICARGSSLLDGRETVAGPGSYEAAIEAVDAALSAADAVMEGAVDNAFCAVRPPGHHALPDRAMGFCLFATPSILVRYLQERHGLRRVAILDWDVHHGNGTQHIFWSDPDVLYVSLHQYPFWPPGSGSSEERGEGAGEGATLNIPIAAGSREADYLERFEGEALPAIEAHHPEAIVVSAGFDAHRDDPLGGLLLTERTFARMTSLAKELAARVCQGRLISLLEGGYNLDALARSVTAHVEALRGD